MKVLNRGFQSSMQLNPVVRGTKEHWVWEVVKHMKGDKAPARMASLWVLLRPFGGC